MNKQELPHLPSMPLGLLLQRFGIAYAQNTVAGVDCQLRESIYNHIISSLSYDPFFPHAVPNFSASLSSQQGSPEGSEYSEEARGRPCGHVFGKGEIVYRCRNCGMDDTCVMCQKCYKASDHEEHDVAMSMNGGSGGCCDCGDKEAWRLDMRCQYHYSSGPVETVHDPDVPLKVETSIRATVSCVLDFILDVMSHAKDSAKPPKLEDDTNPRIDAEVSRFRGSNYDDSLDAGLETAWTTVLWNDEKHNFDEVIDIVKRACQKTKAFGRQIAKTVDVRGRATVYTGSLVEAVRIATFLSKIKLGVTVRCARDVFREDMVEVLVNFLKDLANLSILLPSGERNLQRIRHIICEEMCKPWRSGVSIPEADSLGTSPVPLVDSEDESDDDDDDDIRAIEMMDEIIEAQDTRGTSPDHVLRPNDEIDVESEGDQDDVVQFPLLAEAHRAALLEEHNRRREANGLPIQTALILPTATDILATEETNQERGILRAMLLARGEMRQFTLAANLRGADNVDDEAEEDDNVNDAQNDGTFGEDHENGPVPSLFVDINRDKINPSHWQTDLNRFLELGNTRLTALFLQDLRLWKMARAGLRELYITTMVAIPYFKREMGIRFAIAYKELTEAFLFADREPEQSMILFSVQIFTVPSIAELLVKEYDFMTTLLAVCYTYYSQRKIGHPNEVDTNSKQLADVYDFRHSERHYHIINDLRYLLCTGSVQKLIPSMRNIQLQFVDWLDLFQGQNPQVKQLQRHVEYESDSWIAAFNITMQIAKHAQMFARTFEHAQRSLYGSDDLRFALGVCADRLRTWHQGEHKSCRPAFEPRIPLRNYISFHHPLHWFMVGLATHLTSKDDLSFLCSVGDHEMAFDLAQYIVRVVHMVWEIRCNLWVRNGHSIRIQLFNYTNADSREYCIDKDIQYLQLTLATAGPSLRFGTDSGSWTATAVVPPITYIKHFERHNELIKAIFGSFTSVPSAEYMGHEVSSIHMQDYMFHFLIILFSERTWMIKSHNEENIERALRHGLLFGPKTYSDIAKMVNDDRSDEACFDRVVKRLTDFKPPTGLDDVGRFALKDAEFDRIDPYYHHYSLQQIEEALDILGKRKGEQRCVFESKLISIDETPWNGIVDFVCCPTIQDYIITYFTCLRREAARDSKVTSIRESNTDKLLQLLILALQEEQSRRVRGAVTHNWGVFPLKCAEYFLQSALVSDPCLKAHHAKLTLIFDRLTQLNDEMDDDSQLSSATPSKREFRSDSQDDENSEFLRKKALAKARQAKLMNDMKLSQKAFMSQNESDDPGVMDDATDSDTDMSDTESIWHFPAGNCIICQNAVAADGETYGVLSCIQDSRLDRPTPTCGADLNSASLVTALLSHPESLDQEINWTSTGMKDFPMSQTRSRNTLTTCGHVMHFTCYDQFFDAIKASHTLWSNQGRNMPSKIQYQCPLCKTVGNTLLPILSKSKDQVWPIFSNDPDHDYRNTLNRAELLSIWEVAQTPQAALGLARDLSHDLKVNRQLTERIRDMQLGDDRVLNRPIDLDAWDWYAAFKKSYRDHSSLRVNHENYATGSSAIGVMHSKLTGLLIGSVVDIEVALRDRLHNDNKRTLNHTLIEGMSEQNLLSLRVQSTVIQALQSLTLYTIARSEAVVDVDDFSRYYLQRRSEARRDQLFASVRPPHVTMHFPELLHEDIFAACVEASLGSQDDSTLDFLANLFLEAEMVKVLLEFGTKLEALSVDCDSTLVEALEPSTHSFSQWCKHLCPEMTAAKPEQFCALYNIMKRYALVFVRKYAIFAVAIRNKRLPTNGADTTELQRLSRYLNIRQLNEILCTKAGDFLESRRMHLNQQWISQVAQREFKVDTRLSWPLPLQLTELPKSLDVLFERCLNYVCPNCETTPTLPALCLLCGAILCFQSACCWSDELGAGECTSHRLTCGGSLGLYFVVKRCTLLVMRQDGGAFGQAPYLDNHGEPDPDLQRGKPQFLNEKRYEIGVRQLYLQHQVGTWLARKLDNYADMGGWETT